VSRAHRLPLRTKAAMSAPTDWAPRQPSPTATSFRGGPSAILDPAPMTSPIRCKELSGKPPPPMKPSTAPSPRSCRISTRVPLAARHTELCTRSPHRRASTRPLSPRAKRLPARSTSTLQATSRTALCTTRETRTWLRGCNPKSRIAGLAARRRRLRRTARGRRLRRRVARRRLRTARRCCLRRVVRRCRLRRVARGRRLRRTARRCRLRRVVRRCRLRRVARGRRLRRTARRCRLRRTARRCRLRRVARGRRLRRVTRGHRLRRVVRRRFLWWVVRRCRLRRVARGRRLRRRVARRRLRTARRCRLRRVTRGHRLRQGTRERLPVVARRRPPLEVDTTRGQSRSVDAGVVERSKYKVWSAGCSSPFQPRSQVPSRRSASSISRVGPAKDSRTNELPCTVSKSIPGAIATPVSANNFEQNAIESSVNSETSA
jgi:hypothetical protein